MGCVDRPCVFAASLRWIGVALILLGSARPYGAAAQARHALPLPAILREPDRLVGQIVSVSTLASEPGLILIERNAPIYAPPDSIYDPWFSRDGGQQCQGRSNCWPRWAVGSLHHLQRAVE